MYERAKLFKGEIISEAQFMHNSTNISDWFYVKGLTGVGQNCHRQHCATFHLPPGGSCHHAIGYNLKNRSHGRLLHP